MIIDIHNHADYHRYNVRQMLRNMDDNGIDITCLLSWEAPETDFDPMTRHALSPLLDTPLPFERAVAYKEAAPDRFLLGFCPDPRRPEAIQRLKSALGLFDLSLCGELKLRMMYDNPDAIRMYRYCGEEGLPVLLHLEYELPGASKWPWPSYWYGGAIETLERVLAQCPETIFIGHAPGFWAHISADGKHLTESYPAGPVVPGGAVARLLDRFPNLYCDISAGSGHNALNRDRDYARSFLLAYQDKICFGRDYYDSVHRELLESLNLPPEVLEKIYCGNAKRILRGGGKI
ncbi:MAG: amidohydrolase [Clostridiales bacterium]|jgi:predicted TIM-barrel fold metal-dependent hydrolase|nr:amidohydrolase [Clostridiales bacterium]